MGNTLQVSIRNDSLFAILLAVLFIAYFGYELVRNHLSALLELKLKEQVTTTKRRWIEAVTEKDKELARAELLSAYNQACVAYLSKQILPDNFVREYILEIKWIAETEELASAMLTKQETYTGIWMVYDRWKKKLSKLEI